MRVRKLDANGDYSFGHGQADFYRDQPEAPAQCVQTRLGLYVGEWFLDVTAGTPWRTKVLGRRTDSTRDPAVRARILGTQGVTGILSFASQVNRDTRGYGVQVTVDTAYGQGFAVAAVNAPMVDVRQGR